MGNEGVVKSIFKKHARSCFRSLFRISLSLSHNQFGEAWCAVSMRRSNARKLSWTLTRFFTNLGYKFRGISGAGSFRPSTTILIVAAIGLSIFFLVGGVFNILERPLALLPKGSGWTFVYKGSLHIQTLNESIVSGLLYVLAIAGLYLLLKGTRSVYNPRHAYLMLILGFVVTLVVAYYTLSLLDSKISA